MEAEPVANEAQNQNDIQRQRVYKTAFDFQRIETLFLLFSLLRLRLVLLVITK